MRLWYTLTAPSQNSRLPFSLKVLFYSCFTSFFGTAVLYCGLGIGFTDPLKNPYAFPYFVIFLSVALVIFFLTAALWLSAIAQAPRKWLNLLLTSVFAVIIFCLSWPLLRDLYEFAKTMLHTHLQSQA
ncbi:MAG: hypothetical protein E7645_04900 [Ruminococcaceae bacterium]|nr:hypothetical protein [Oscillospiraceae bacterium]